MYEEFDYTDDEDNRHFGAFILLEDAIDYFEWFLGKIKEIEQEPGSMFIVRLELNKIDEHVEDIRKTKGDYDLSNVMEDQ